MSIGHTFWENLTQETGLNAQPVPGLPIVEVAGEHRVLIENHFGIIGYSRERIAVKVSYGAVWISGCNLELLRMTKEQLVIRGTIETVTLCRRN